LKNGVTAGDTVALMMENRPEYFFIWLGVAKIGAKTALINFNLKHKALVHSLSVSNSKILFFGSELHESIQESFEEINKLGLKFVHQGGPCEIGISLEDQVLPTNEIPYEKSPRAQGVGYSDPALYVYTSGTTGLPKAAIVTHHRIALASFAFSNLFSVTNQDIVYCPLPLYHSAAGVIGIGMLLQKGALLVLRKKFSASKFISDIKENNCTITQYIGEICRYVIATPEKPDDKNNKLRLALGNGLRPDIWKTFQERFGITQIGEFYAATEGAAPLFNTCNKFGAIGFISPLVQPITPVRIFKFDHETEELVRDSKGRCIPCGYDEPGEFVAKIYKIKKASNFSGYTNAEASKKKIVTDVIQKGDQWFRSGDLMKIDRNGFVYFVDRIGDTFRWKGENCSTAEIAQIMGVFLNGAEINVYGVSIPGKDGRAGMAAVVSKDSLDLDGLAAHAIKQLPSYAVPLFIRKLEKEMDITGTFKHRKVELRDEGFDPSKITDPIYFFEPSKKTYVPLTKPLYDEIVSPKSRL